MAALRGLDCHAQWYGGYTEAATPYSAAVRSEAEMTIARGAAAESAARAAISREEARSAYIDNEFKFIQLRRENRDIKDAREAKKKQEQKERAALRPPPRPLTALYPRLSSDQIDPLTGEIHWPGCLMGSGYAAGRKSVEDSLKTQAEYGPNDRSTKTISDASQRMMKKLSGDYAALGPENYAPCRKFLTSLSVEGNHAQEALK
jgi:hypothetical protein